MEIVQILSEVNLIFKRVFENENIIAQMETTANDVEEWNSMSHITMISEVEKHFNVQFKLKELLGFKNVGDMVRAIHAKKQGA
jgi:acyl carrier protein